MFKASKTPRSGDDISSLGVNDESNLNEPKAAKQWTGFLFLLLFTVIRSTGCIHNKKLHNRRIESWKK